MSLEPGLKPTSESFQSGFNKKFYDERTNIHALKEMLSWKVGSTNLTMKNRKEHQYIPNCDC